MLLVDTIRKVRLAHRDGKGIREITRMLSLSRNTPCVMESFQIPDRRWKFEHQNGQCRNLRSLEEGVTVKTSFDGGELTNAYFTHLNQKHQITFGSHFQRYPILLRYWTRERSADCNTGKIYFR